MKGDTQKHDLYKLITKINSKKLISSFRLVMSRDSESLDTSEKCNVLAPIGLEVDIDSFCKLTFRYSPFLLEDNTAGYCLPTDLVFKRPAIYKKLNAKNFEWANNRLYPAIYNSKIESFDKQVNRFLINTEREISDLLKLIVISPTLEAVVGENPTTLAKILSRTIDFITSNDLIQESGFIKCTNPFSKILFTETDYFSLTDFVKVVHFHCREKNAPGNFINY